MKPQEPQDGTPRPRSRHYGIVIGLVAGGIVVSLCCIGGLLAMVLVGPRFFFPSIVGTWQNANGLEVIQFFADGTFEETRTVVGRVKVKGKYELLDGGGDQN